MRIARPRGFSTLLSMALALFAGLALLPTIANASVVIYDTSNTVVAGSTITLAQFISGYKIDINNGFDTKEFQGVAGSYNSTGFSGAAAADATKINVTGLDTGGLNPGPGLLYQTVAQWSVGANQGQDTKFNYTVTILGPSAYAIHDDGLTLGAATVGGNTGGQIRIIEAAVNPNPPNNQIADQQILLINTAGTTTGATTDQVFYTPQTSVLIKKDIGIQGGDLAGTSFTDMTQNFSQVAVPEPSSLAIAGIGALGMIGYGVRRRLKK